ncbi:hypothetical protein CIB95_00135 [Lottiidibacillus patelloidae]|uniref:DUF2269 domain-containing protein n=1 Tax=Lottiidibacillus patelloidae TaxID=2670334 RepID=A0A263BXJ8_9BACI|nr:DUF2269 family protein [Lottiidibacillus patelloidae]OZM58027.1 hypothetical protein CIB95_00135 [Lottiidibacillus patelloidae]
MSLYAIILIIHLVSAVIGLGVSFGMPIVLRLVKTTTQAKFAHEVNVGLEKYAKIGSITLLVTGLVMGALHPYLFKEIWYIASIVIYIAVQPIVAGILPKKTAKQLELLQAHKEEELPEEYQKLTKEMLPLHNVLMVSVVILVVLMSIKPF